MKIRQGRHNPRILYVQLGAQPSDDDPMLCTVVSRDAAELLADVASTRQVATISALHRLAWEANR